MKNRKPSIRNVVMAAVLAAAFVLPLPTAVSAADKAEAAGLAAKNVILMIADGWGYNQILATDYYINGRAGTQIYEMFPARLAMSTYSMGDVSPDDDALFVYDPVLKWDDFNQMKKHATDSAAAATAMATGVKTYNGAIGVDIEQKAVANIAELFEAKDRATGVVSSVMFCHATPAGFIAHNTSRNNYSGIAREMIYDSATDVIMGAGNPYFNNDGEQMSGSFEYVVDQNTWEGLEAGRIGNDADGDGDVENWRLVQTKQDFEALRTGDTPERVIGVPQVHQTLQQKRSGGSADAYAVPMNDNVPTLAVMTQGALNVLDNDEDGFFLMVEGGAVDWAGHDNQSGRLIEEQVDFNAAVDAVCAWVKQNNSWSETLVIVTGDHETGYLTGALDEYREVGSRGRGVMPVMVWNSGGHTSQLVPFFARGPGAEMLENSAEQKDPVRGSYLDNTQIKSAIAVLISNVPRPEAAEARPIWRCGFDKY